MPAEIVVSKQVHESVPAVHKVIFAGDEYGESVCWKVGEAAIGKTMEREIKGKIWLTYWPNKRRAHHSETRLLDFRELVYLSIEK